MSVQRDEAWVLAAGPEERVAAQRAGELAHFLGGSTPEETAQAAYVAGSQDRVQRAAYGRIPGDADSNWFEAKRRAMTPEQLEKLAWVEGSNSADVFAAEQAGDLDHLLGLDVAKEVARLDAVSAHVRETISGKLGA